MEEGDRVRWRSRVTGRIHDGTVRSVRLDMADLTGRPYLVQPDGDVNRWSDWIGPADILS